MEERTDNSKADRNSHVRPHIWKADELAKEFKFKEAIAEYDFIIQNGVDLPPVFFSQRGYFKFRALDYDGCIADCTKALEIDPNLTHALYHRAAALKEAEKHEEAALDDLNRLLKLEPQHALGLYLRAFMYGNAGQWEQAISAWEPYIELKPGDMWAHLYRGIALAEIGRKREAIQEYLEGSKINPRFKSFYFRRWLLYRELNEPELAQKDFEAGKAILDAPDETPAQDPRDPAVQRAQDRLRKLNETSLAERQEHGRAW